MRLRAWIGLLVFLLAIGQESVSSASAEQTLRAHQKLISSGIASIWSETRDADRVAEFLRAHGLVKVAVPEKSVGLMSNSSNVDLPGVSVYNDRYARQYVLYFDFQWLDTDKGGLPDWYDDSYCQFPLSCNVGGADMWGIHLNRDDALQLDYQQLVLYDNAGYTTVVADQPVYNSGNNGAAFEHQDVVNAGYYPPRYNADHGGVVLWMTKIGSGRVEGSISNSGIEVKFSSSSNKWDIQGRTVTRLDL